MLYVAWPLNAPACKGLSHTHPISPTFPFSRQQRELGKEPNKCAYVPFDLLELSRFPSNPDVKKWLFYEMRYVLPSQKIN